MAHRTMPVLSCRLRPSRYRCFEWPHRPWVRMGSSPQCCWRGLPCVESTFERIEHWSSSEDPAGFWLVQSPDGNTHLFAKPRQHAARTGARRLPEPPPRPEAAGGAAARGPRHGAALQHDADQRSRIARIDGWAQRQLREGLFVTLARAAMAGRATVQEGQRAIALVLAAAQRLVGLLVVDQPGFGAHGLQRFQVAGDGAQVVVRQVLRAVGDIEE